MEPSPIASTQSGGYRLVSGLAAKIFDAPVAPLLLIGATDSRHMTVLTDDIYRFSPYLLDLADAAIVHGFDERISVENLGRMLEFYQQVLVDRRAAQAARGKGFSGRLATVSVRMTPSTSPLAEKPHYE